MHAQLLGFDSVSRRRGFSRTWLLGLLLFITAVAVPCEATRAPGDTRPNLVLFFPDTIAAEAMGSYYKNPIVRVPNFEKLARAGTVFTTAYSSYPQCSPSRAALITGVRMHFRLFMRGLSFTCSLADYLCGAFRFVGPLNVDSSSSLRRFFAS